MLDRYVVLAHGELDVRDGDVVLEVDPLPIAGPARRPPKGRRVEAIVAAFALTGTPAAFRRAAASSFPVVDTASAAASRPASTPLSIAADRSNSAFAAPRCGRAVGDARARDI
jgi:hypothetical protein